ncbi:MAG: hypothetical protein ACI9KE_001260 [Polyangiales bacterium]|jgi:hypothetical protein
MHLNLLSIIPCAVALLLPSASALADEPARTAVMRPAVAGVAQESLGGPVGRVVRARVDELGVVRAADTPAATFADLQLAVGCLSATMDCYRAVSSQLGVEALLLTTLDEVGAATILTIVFADTRGEGDTQQVTRTFQGNQRDNQVLDAIVGMLYELYDVEPPPERSVPTPPDASGGTGTRTGQPIAPAGSSFPTATVLVGVVALAALAAGIGTGIASSGTEDSFASSPTRTAAEVDLTLALQTKGERQALSANILFVVGGVAAASSLLLYLLVDRDRGQQEIAASMDVGPQHAALTIAGRFGGVR